MSDLQKTKCRRFPSLHRPLHILLISLDSSQSGVKVRVLEAALFTLALPLQLNWFGWRSFSFKAEPSKFLDFLSVVLETDLIVLLAWSSKLHGWFSKNVAPDVLIVESASNFVETELVVVKTASSFTSGNTGR